MVVAAIAIFITASGDVSTYASFGDAAISQGKVKIVGELDREFPVHYDPDTDPNIFRFHMVDNNGESKKVIVGMPKPQDFEKSEQVVVTGKMKDDTFVASEVLTKCPSKYKDEELSLRSDS